VCRRFDCDGRATRKRACRGTAVSGATGYNVKRSTTSGTGYVTVGSPAFAKFTDGGLANDTTYYYVVSALNASGESADSAEAGAIPFGPPIVLTGATVTNGQFSMQFRERTVRITWSRLRRPGELDPGIDQPPSGGVFIFTEGNVTIPERFYRVRQ